MKKIILLISGISLVLIESLTAQVPLSQIEGFLELYMPNDTTSLYMGRNAGQKTTASFLRKNVFAGNNAGKENISGNDNVFIGNIAGEKNTTGNFNVFIGESAGTNNKSGGDNVFIGDGAGFDNVNGYYNVYVGYSAGGSDSNGQHNTYVGHNAGNRGDSTRNNSFFGVEAGGEVEGDCNIYMGAYAGSDAQDGDYNTVVGYYAGEENSGEENTFIGSYAGEDNKGSENTFVGYEAGEENEGRQNVFVGNLSGHRTTGGFNTFIGYESGFSNLDGGANTFIGFRAGRSNIEGGSNVFFGNSAGYSHERGNGQVFLGPNAGVSDINGSSSVVIGTGTAAFDTSIQRSVYIGAGAGQLSNSSNADGRSGNIFIGHFAGVDQTASNRLFIANSAGDSTEALIYGEFDGAGKLRVNGDLHIAANAASGNSRVFMKGIGGQLNEVIRYDGDENDVVMGSVTGAGGKLYLRSDGVTRMAIIENGNVGIGTTNPARELDVAGDISVDGSVYFTNITAGSSTTDLRLDPMGKIVLSSSDIRLKKNISTIPNALSKVLRLRGVQYLWKQDEAAGIQLGVIAQEVKEVVPELVNEANGLYGVDYSETAGLFIEAIKEQQELIEGQQDEIAALKHLLDKAINEIQVIKSGLSQADQTSED